MILHEGLVVKSTGSRYTVKSGNIFYECRIKGKLRIKGIRTTNPLTVGDIVDFEIQNETSENGLPMGVITNLQQRKNYIIRKSVNLSKESHIIASNIDMAFILATINYPVTMPTFIDRFLVTAEAYSIPSVVVFNKIDLYNEEELLRWQLSSLVGSRTKKWIRLHTIRLFPLSGVLRMMCSATSLSVENIQM